MTNEKPEEEKVSTVKDLTMTGVGSAVLEILFMAIYLIGMLSALALSTGYKPPAPEYFMLIAIVLVLLERFAYSFIRASTPLRFYETSGGGDEDEDDDEEDDEDEKEQTDEVKENV